jgi:hypothetical protein
MNVQKQLNQDIFQTLSEFLSSHKENNMKNTYRGKVIDNNDPKKQGRCKVKVYGLYDEIPNSDIPWSNPTQGFLGSDVSSLIIPLNGTIVNVVFEDDDVYKPVYTTKTFITTEIPSKAKDGYPDNMVFFESNDGDSFTFNRKTGDMILTHRSGTIIELNKDIKIESSDGSKIEMDKDITVEGSSGSSVTIKSNGDIEIGGSGLMQALLTESFKTALEAHTHTVVVAGATLTTSSPTILPEIIPYTTDTTKAN